jgi:hypothetical protein
MIEQSLPWLILFGLGSLHGINPGMGWLFAVALGLQEGNGRAVWRALLPLAGGHALAIAAAVLIASVAGLMMPPSLMKWIVVGLLFGLGVWRLVRHQHKQRFGMRVNARDLTLWSFLMASAHGAGFMVLPVVLGAMQREHMHMQQAHHMVAAGVSVAGSYGVLATAVHSAGYLLITGIVAALVYRKLGLRVLRRWWFNFDVVWAGALIVTALALL